MKKCPRCAAFLALLLFSCAPDWETSIEDTIYSIRENNDSSHSVFIQYYLNDGSVARVSLAAHSANDYGGHNGSAYYFPYFTPDGEVPPEGLHPNDQLARAVIIDTDTKRLLKTTSGAIFALESASDNEGLRCRFEYYVFTLTDDYLAAP